jgi:hypothetical protein
MCDSIPRTTHLIFSRHRQMLDSASTVSSRPYRPGDTRRAPSLSESSSIPTPHRHDHAGQHRKAAKWRNRNRRTQRTLLSIPFGFLHDSLTPWYRSDWCRLKCFVRFLTIGMVDGMLAMWGSCGLGWIGLGWVGFGLDRDGTNMAGEGEAEVSYDVRMGEGEARSSMDPPKKS